MKLIRGGTKSLPKKNRRYFAFSDYWILPIILFSIVSTIITPRKISFDGHLYLSSSEALFTSHFAEYYHFVREPLYPILIWPFLKLNRLDYLFYFQAILLVMSIYLIGKTFKNLRVMNEIHLAISGTLSFIFVRGYAVSVLQQTLIIFLGSALIYVLANNHKSLDRFRAISLSLIMSLALNLFFAFGISCILATFMFFLLSGKQPRRLYKNLFIVILISLMSILPWIAIKNNSETDKAIFKSPPANARLIESNSNLDLSRLNDFIQTSLATIGLSPEINSSPMPINFEASIYGMPYYGRDFKCASVDPGFEPIQVHIRQFIEDIECVPQDFMEASNILGGIARGTYWIPNLVFLALLLNCLFFRDKRYLVFMVTSSLIVLPYVLSNLGISRYGALVYVISPFLLLNEFLLTRNFKGEPVKPKVQGLNE